MSEDANDPSNLGMPFFSEMAKAMSGSGPVQWDIAKQVAQSTAMNSTPDRNVEPTVRIAIQQLATIADMHVRDITGLNTSDSIRVPEIEVVNRTMWVDHTLAAYRPFFVGFATSISGNSLIDSENVEIESSIQLPDNIAIEMIANVTKMMAPAMIGMSVGSMIGHLSLRAFGQYDLPIPRNSRTKLLFIAQNCEQFASDWSINLADMQMWLIVQELTFHSLFRIDHVSTAITQAVTSHVSGFRPNPNALAERLATIEITSADPAKILQRLLGDPSLLLGATSSAQQQALRPQLDAMVCAIVSYVDYVVDAVASRILGNGSQIAEAVRRRRVEATTQDQFVERLFGINLTTAQLDSGQKFIAGVIDRDGTPGLSGLWQRKGNLPTPNELVAPGLWLERIKI